MSQKKISNPEPRSVFEGWSCGLQNEEWLPFASNPSYTSARFQIHVAEFSFKTILPLPVHGRVGLGN